MLRRASILVGFAFVALVSAPLAAQTVFDPEKVELEEEPISTPEEPAEPEADEPARPPTAQPQARPTEASPRAAATRRVTLPSRPRARRAVVQQVGPAIPPDLQPWVGWALHNSEDLVCPDVSGTRTCRWPGLLRIQASSDGASFSFEVWADRDTEFQLPGGREYWPQEVRVDGAAPTVLASADSPSVTVAAGAHRIEGRFLWDELPEVLPVPTDVANVELTLDGRETGRPRVDAEGRLWLRDGASDGGGENEADSVSASIYRRFSDGVPLTVTTRLRLNVSGRAREVELGKILLADSRPIAVRAQIPVQVAGDGATKVYVRPGSHDIEVDAVLHRRIDQIAAPQPTPNFYDPQEVWVWVPNEAVRSVELDGLTAVDPQRTSLPSEWGGYTTFLAEPGRGLKLRVTRRGVEETQPNVINLDRDLWLDLDGAGYTIRDQLNGVLHEQWRLDYGTSGDARLGRVAEGGENLLITNEPGTGLSGVELRNSALNLVAEVRVENARSHLAIVGWDHDVQSLNARIHLPPGWTLLGGKGVDSMSGTWLASWDPWDVFFVLMIAVVIGRLFGWPWAFIALIGMCLAHEQPDAPKWVWVHLIITLALLRVLPRGWPRKLVVTYRWAALVFLAILLTPFAHDQILVAFNPQVSLAQPHSDGGGGGGFLERDMKLAMPSAAPPMEAAAGGEAMDEWQEEESLEQDKSMRKKEISGKDRGGLLSSYDAPAQLQQIDPNAVVQTGPGLPNWTWSTWNLGWTGPVRRDHVVTLWLVSPAFNAALAVLRVVLLIFLALLLLAPRDMFWERRKPVPDWWRRLFGNGMPLVLAVFAFGVAEREPAAAEIPGAEVLQELRNRIETATTCPLPCAVASDAAIVVNGLEFEMSAEVSAARDTAWTLPGPADALRIESVSVDGTRTNRLRRSGGMVQVRLDAGTHEVLVTGSLADRNTVTIQFDEATRPRHVSFDSGEWTADGVSPTGVPDNSLQLTRTSGRPDATQEHAAQVELPPWYQVERVVALGMPWQMQTVVRRDDTTRPQLVKIPLVGAEKVITEGVRVESGFALVDFARGQSEAAFSAEIPIGPTVKLKAALDQPWTESWVVDCSRIWRCAFSNLPPVATVTDGAWRPRWQPWPGESLEINVSKPEGAEGQPKTVESVHYAVTPGKRLMQARLGFTIRASQGDWQEVTLPPGAELQSVSIDGQNRTIRPQDGVVRLPVQPGESRYELQWQQAWERTMTERVPLVDIGSAAANVETIIHLGGERWLLRVLDDEMPWGPAVLFWWTLVLVTMLASILATIPHMPLKWWEWALLAMGMSQMPAMAMLPVIFWFLLVSWRGREPIDPWWRFDLTQLFIVLLTFMAVGALIGAVYTNFVVDIEMQVDGYGSSNFALQWYSDRVTGALPTPAIVSLPEWVFRLVTFLWALWLVKFFVSCAKWGWTNFSTDGWWRFPKSPPIRRSVRVPPSPGPPPAPTDDLPEVPSPVPRNATDGAVVRAEFNLRRPSVPAAVEEPAESTPPDEIKEDGELGGLTTDEVIGALVDDSSEVIDDADIVAEHPDKTLRDDWMASDEEE